MASSFIPIDLFMPGLDDIDIIYAEKDIDIKQDLSTAPTVRIRFGDLARQVIVAKHAKDALEVSERQLVSLEKCLLRGTWISPVKRCAAGHRTHREDLQLDPFAIKIGVRLVPDRMSRPGKVWFRRRRAMEKTAAMPPWKSQAIPIFPQL
jgi:hypothetical protein